MHIRFRRNPSAGHLGRLSARAVHFLRQTNYALISRATAGSPAKLRAYAERLRLAEDELRFRKPLAAFAAFLGDVAGIADTTALQKESARLAALRQRRGWYGGTADLRIAAHGLAKFSQRQSSQRGT